MYIIDDKRNKENCIKSRYYRKKTYRTGIIDTECSFQYSEVEPIKKCPKAKQ
jgi:hypothetical protein